MRKILLALLMCGNTAAMFAETPADTLTAKKVMLDEITIDGFKQPQKDKIPSSVSVINAGFLRNNEIRSVKDLSGMIPNFFIPDYGSRQSSPIYIRGIGSRTSGVAPSVSLYLDGMPLFEASSFDFDLLDISNIEVLRGPQGTLYGRNSIGGIINLYTYSPLMGTRTTARVGYGSYNDLVVAASHYHKISNLFGVYATGSYHHNDGFFYNITQKNKADKIDNFAGRAGLEWRMTPQWLLRWQASASRSIQNGYPYSVLNTETHELAPINYDEPSKYLRTIAGSGLNLLYQQQAFSINSQTSYQFIKDNQTVDQDFTPAHVFRANNEGHQHLVSQEFTIKGKEYKAYRWMFGAFALYQSQDREIAVDRFTAAKTTVNTTDIKTSNIALYHQSTLDIFKGLSATAGVRYEIENASSNQILKNIGKDNQTAHPLPLKNLRFDRFTPKFSIQYTCPGFQMVYASVAKGFKAGGFNTTVKEDDPTTFTFDPEDSWNYELGVKTDLLNHKLFADVALFYIDWRNQQLAQTIPGVGNIIRNMGQSVSKGVEASVTYKPIKQLQVQVNYGYTYAKYDKVEGDSRQKYENHWIPMVPRHTLNGNVRYTIDKVWVFDRVDCFAGVTANGPFYWNEDNAVQQDMYALLNAKIAVTKGIFTAEIWAKNITSTDYYAYLFKTSQTYAQPGKPRTIGASLLVNF